MTVKIPWSEIEPALEGDENSGWCLACGNLAEDDVEPDAHGYHCTVCHADKVYGAQEIVLMGAVNLEA